MTMGSFFTPDYVGKVIIAGHNAYLRCQGEEKNLLRTIFIQVLQFPCVFQPNI